MKSNSIWMEFISLWPFLKVVSLGLYTTKPVVVSPCKACCSNLGKCDFALIMMILFGFCVICIKPCLMEYLQKEFWVSFQASWKFWHILIWLCYCFSLSGRGTNVAGVQHMFRLPSKWCEVAELKFPVCKQLVIPLFLGPYLRFHFHLFSSSLGVISSSKATFHILKGTIAFFSSSSTICCKHTTFSSLPFSRYAKITNGTTHTCT